MLVKNSCLSIMIVEDSRTQAEELRFILENNGYEVRAALNGKEALGMIEALKPDIVISDINMPEMDGYELCNRIKSDSELAKIPVILVTALSETGDLMRGLECGADSYITKPYDESDLLKCIMKVLQAERVLLDENTLVVPFIGESYRIENNASRILDFLITTYDLAVKKNASLSNANAQLNDEISDRKMFEKSLNRSNEFLTILHNISMVASESLQMDVFIPKIIKAVTVIGMLKCEPRGIIFLADEEGLHLTYDMGHTKEFQEAHRTIPYGTCLCGLAAKTGEVIISGNSDTDKRHTIRPPGIAPHGHIIIPLKTKNMLVGILCLYLAPDDFNLELDSHMTNLFMSLGRQIGMALDNARLYAEVESSSLHDSLTGLANRRMMDLLLDKQYSMVKRGGSQFSIMMLDIDHFKRYNDTRGHAEGDKALVAVAHVVSKEIREIDTVFRYGGEEFLVLLPGISLPDALVVAERVRSAVELRSPVTISLGVVSDGAGGIDQKEELIAKADAALYRAKQNGRNRVET